MRRSTFLRNSFWLTGGLITGCGKNSIGSTSSPNKSVITGIVSSNGKGIAGVIVSDGYSVVSTASDGSYSMELLSRSEHVFVSIPPGYEIPHIENIANHYKRVDTGGAFNFQLQPLATNDDQHQFMIWADPQVKYESDVEKLFNQSVPDVQEHLKSLPNNTLIHGICVGDIVWDAPALYKDYIEAIGKCNLPFFQVLGNHDMDYRMGGDETSDATFKKTFGPTYYSFNRGQAHYVIMDDVFYLGTDKKYKGYITTAQLNWLRKDLSHISTDKLIIVCLHIPVHNDVENNSELYEILQPYHNVHIMSGHTHYNQNVIRDNVYEHVHGTVCGAWWTGPICDDGTPPGYAIYEINGTDIQWYYKSTGENKRFQIRTWNEINGDGDKELYANVWNADPEWKVEWDLNGVNKGSMTQVSDYDSLAVTLYKGDQLPESRTFVEPHKTDHIFKTLFPADPGEIKILVTDRFGNKYESIV